MLLLVSLAMLIAGSHRLAETQDLEFWPSVSIVLGVILLAAALTLITVALTAPRGADARVPGPGGLVLLIVAAAFIGASCVAVADAFTERSGGQLMCPPEDNEEEEDTAVAEGQRERRTGPSTFVVPEESQEALGLTIQLGRNRPAGERASQRLVLDSGEESVKVGRVQVYLSDLRRDDGTRMNGRLVNAIAEVEKRGRSLVVTLCVQPESKRFAEMHPGRYRGTLSINGGRVNPIDLPVTVELQFNRLPILLVLLVGTVVVATFVLFNGVMQLSGRTASLRPRRMREFGTWIINNPVAIGTGVVAAVALFANQYLADPVWSGRPGEVFALIGAMFGAYVGVATVAAGVGPKRAGDIEAAEQASDLASERDFPDVGPRGEQAARWAADIGGITPIEGLFKPARSATLAEVAQTLYQAWGAPDVTGAPPHGFIGADEDADRALRWVTANDVIPGVTGVGRARRPVTRTQVAKALHGLAGWPPVGPNAPTITDLPAGAATAVRWVVKHGVMTGFPDGTFRGADEITRLQLARAVRHAQLLFGPELATDEG